MSARTYPKTQGTCDLQLMYGCNAERNKTLRDLGYTWQSARDWAPAFTQYWIQRGWDTNRFLDLYEIEAAHNDWLIATDTYMGIGVYVRNSFIFQSRATILWPDGWYRMRFGAMTALGRYVGKHPNVYSDQTGANPGSTPGTCLEVDLAGWMSELQPNRVCMPATAWMADYGTAGGLAYTEGVYIEGFRFEGGMSGRNQDPSFQSGGISLNEPGENSGVLRCMFANFNNDGLWMFNGTPGNVELCSFFYNYGRGFGHTSSNGLCNVTITTPSGDNNRGGLLGTRPRDAQSVAGGNFNIRGLKSEARSVLQRLFVCEGTLGQLTLTVDGITADYNNVTCPELISIEKGSSWEVNVRGLMPSSGVQSLLYHAESRKRLTGGVFFSGNSFVVNSEGFKGGSRSNMALVDGTSPTGAPVIDSFTSNPASLSVAGPVTLSWQTTNATSVKVNGVAQALVDGSAVFQVGANTTTFTLEATGPAGTTTGTVTVAVTTPAGGYFDRTGWNVAEVPSVDGANEKLRMLDNSLSTFWMGTANSMDPGKGVIIDMQAVKSAKGIEFNPGQGYNNSWPKSFEVFTSTNGSTYTSKGTFTGAFNASASFVQDCRYIKVTVRSGNMGNWWNIADFRVRS